VNASNVDCNASKAYRNEMSLACNAMKVQLRIDAGMWICIHRISGLQALIALSMTSELLDTSTWTGD
jgi:hypothetical protein